jgi:hypothetical protein
MRILECQQGTDEWLLERQNRITATDFAIVCANLGLCKNIYNKSINKLITDKINPIRVEDNKYFKAGRDFEDKYLSSIDNITRGETIVNGRCLASLDARDVFCIYEIKWTSKDNIDELMEYFKYQVLHQCYVAEMDYGKIILKQSSGFIWQKDIYPEKIMDKATWQQHCDDFIKLLDNAQNKTSEEDLILLDRYNELNGYKNDIAKEQEDIKQYLINKYPNGYINNNFKLSIINKKTIKYADFVKKNNLTVDDEFITEVGYYKLDISKEIK